MVLGYTLTITRDYHFNIFYNEYNMQTVFLGVTRHDHNYFWICTVPPLSQPVTVGTDATVFVWFMGHRLEYVKKVGHTPLHLLQL